MHLQKKGEFSSVYSLFNVYNLDEHEVMGWLCGQLSNVCMCVCLSVGGISLQTRLRARQYRKKYKKKDATQTEIKFKNGYKCINDPAWC